MKTVKMTWEFVVDDSWGETDKECIEIAKREFETLTVNDFEFEIRED